MSNEQAPARSGIGFTGLLTVAFIVLKLTHVIGWTWPWVLAPIWISAGVTAVIVALVLLIAFVKVCAEDRRDSKPRR